MDSFFRLNRLLVAALCAFLFCVPPFASARVKEYGYIGSLYPSELHGQNCLVGFALNCMTWDAPHQLAAFATNPPVAEVRYRINGVPYVPGAYIEPPGPLFELVYGCVYSSGQYNPFTIQGCDSDADFHPIAQIMPRCEPGAVRVGWWQTSIASGNILTGFTPAGTPPPSLCVDGCVMNPNNLTYAAKIRVGEAGVGDDLWVGIQGQETASICLPDEEGGPYQSQPAPDSACDPSMPGCGTSGGPGGTGGGLDETDKANLAGIRGSSAALLDAFDKYAKGTDLNRSGTFQNCAEAYTCSGDHYRCAILFAERTKFCETQFGDGEARASIEDLGLGLLNATPADLRAELKAAGKTIDISEGFTRPRWLQPAACPQPVSFSMLGRSYEVGFSAFCDLAQIISVMVVAGASVVGIRIFAGGMS